MRDLITTDQLPSVKKENEIHLQRYVKFINSRPERKLHQKGFYTHHIYPRSLAKKNNVEDFNGDWNLIELTPREHYIAHLILYYCKYSEMISAFYFIANTYGLKGRSLTSRQYHNLHEQNSNFLKNRTWLSNENGDEISVQLEDVERYLNQDFYYGRSCLPTKNKISMTNGKNNVFIEKEKLDLYIQEGYRQGQTGKTTRNRIRITKDTINKTIEKDQLPIYLADGWIQGIENHIKFKFVKITNGIVNRKVYDFVADLYTIQGWRLGTTKKPTLGRKRMTDGLDNKFVKEKDQEEFLQKGWKFGFTAETTKDRIRINRNKKSKLIKKEDLEYYVSNGWLIGMPKDKGEING